MDRVTYASGAVLRALQLQNVQHRLCPHLLGRGRQHFLLGIRSVRVLHLFSIYAGLAAGSAVCQRLTTSWLIKLSMNNYE